ncbi:MAG: hypothetical protein CM15mP92_1090 [Halieaceae bacterium]|nr:MAG: hypothetical protein CM15mP92_1090 [Halieaceae bacterium]
MLGVALLNINQAHNFIESLFYGLGAALGFSLVLVYSPPCVNAWRSPTCPSPFRAQPLA